MSKKVQRKCGTCKWLRPRSDGKPFHHSHAYACMWQPPRPQAWPESWVNQAERNRGEIIGGYMEPGAGKECPCWEIVF